MTLILIPISIIFPYLVFKLYKEVFKKRLIEKAIEKKILDTRISYFSKTRIEKYLRSRGIDYINEVGYIMGKLILSILVPVACIIQFNIKVAIIGLIVGFFILDVTIELSNKQDNKKIASDIVRVFDSLKIQICAGAYITDALKESYLIAKNKRFKKALGELTSELTLTNDFENAVDKFNSKFNDKYIDIFCITIKQGNETGQINKILEDTSESMKQIERIIQKEETKKVELKSSMIQMMVYLGVLAVVIFGLIGQLTVGISSI